MNKPQEPTRPTSPTDTGVMPYRIVAAPNRPLARAKTFVAATVLAGILTARTIFAQETPATGRALNIPKPAPTNEAPYAPQPIIQGGIVLPLYAPDSPQLNHSRIRE